MFFSLNKRFFITIIAFLILCSGIFLIIFDSTIGKKIQAEHSNIVNRNQYVIELLNENISLRKKISHLQPETKIQLLTIEGGYASELAPPPHPVNHRVPGRCGSLIGKTLSQIMTTTPKDVHVLFPRTCEYGTLP